MEKGGMYIVPGRPLRINIIPEKPLNLVVMDKKMTLDLFHEDFFFRELHEQRGKNIWVRAG